MSNRVFRKMPMVWPEETPRFINWNEEESTGERTCHSCGKSIKKGNPCYRTYAPHRIYSKKHECEHFVAAYIQLCIVCAGKELVKVEDWVHKQLTKYQVYERKREPYEIDTSKTEQVIR